MTKDEIIKALRDMAKYPTVTLPRDCDALRAAADLLAQPAPYMAVSNDRISVDPHTGNVSIGGAAQPAMPLTDDVIVEAFCKAPHQTQYVAWFAAGVRFAEAAHGIKE